MAESITTLPKPSLDVVFISVKDPKQKSDPPKSIRPNAESFWAIFDWKIRSFAGPGLIRTLWQITLVLVGLIFLGAVVTASLGVLSVLISAAYYQQVYFMLFWLFRLVLVSACCLFVLLIMRTFCEGYLVLFEIANTLRSRSDAMYPTTGEEEPTTAEEKIPERRSQP